MRGKILVHKSLRDTYGVFEGKEIYHCSTPYLFSINATMEIMKDLQHSLLKDVSQLDDYDLIEVELIPKSK